MNFDTPAIRELKATVATANRILAQTGLAVGAMAHLGHASARIPDTEYVVMKGRGYAIDSLAKMRPEDMLVLDLDANVVDGPRGVIPQNEVKMHTRLYRARPDVGGVVHVHPRFAVVLSVVGKPIVPVCLEGLDLAHAGIPVYPSNELIASDAQGDRVARKMGKKNAILLRGHGAVTAGASVQEATVNMIHLEEHARMNYWVHLLARGARGARVSPAQAQAVLDFLPTMPDLPVLRKAAAERGHTRVPVVEIQWRIFADAARADREGPA